MKYRCGWCGQPTDKDGTPIEVSIDQLNYESCFLDKAESVPGDCCRHRIEEEIRYVTKEMAMDAEDPSREGSVY